MGKRKNYVGLRFGKFTITEVFPRVKGDRTTFLVKAVCDCGLEEKLRYYTLRFDYYNNGCKECRKKECKICKKVFYPNGTQSLCSPECKSVAIKTSARGSRMKATKRDPQYYKKIYQKTFSGTPEEVAAKLAKIKETRERLKQNPEAMKKKRLRDAAYRSSRRLQKMAIDIGKIADCESLSVKRCVRCQKPVVGRKPEAKFCSVVCSNRFAKVYIRERLLLSRPLSNCDECGKEFTSINGFTCCSKQCHRIKKNRIQRALYRKKKG